MMYVPSKLIGSGPSSLYHFIIGGGTPDALQINVTLANSFSNLGSGSSRNWGAMVMVVSIDKGKNK